MIRLMGGGSAGRAAAERPAGARWAAGRLATGRLAAALLMSAAWVAVAQAAEVYAVDVPAGALGERLLAVGRQTHTQLFFSAALVRGRRAPALRGRFTADEAVARLVAGADLSVSRAGPQVLVLERRPPAPGAGGPAREADPGRPFPTAGGTGGGAEALATGAVTGLGAPTVLDEVEVTGSHIRGGVAVSPLVVLDRDDLERTGRTTVAEALRTLPANFSGGATDGAALTGSDRSLRNPGFGTGLNLRGLGNNATLVLINGRRVAGSGAFGDFVDVSTIPSVAVSRVDVLLDGASAVYGSDAVGGVVNIVLRTDYEGAETRLLVGSGTAGEPREGQVSQVVGWRWGSGGIVAAYELQRRDFLSASARAFTADADLRPLGGSDWRVTTAFPGNVLRIDPANGTIAPFWAIPEGQAGVGLQPQDFQAGVVRLQNPRAGADVLPRQTLNAVYVAVDQAVGSRLQLSGDARLSSRRFKIHIAPATSSLTVTTANPFFASPNGSRSHIIAYSFDGQLPAPQQSGLVESVALSLGGRLQLPREWLADGYLTAGRETAELRNRGAVNSLFLGEALGTVPDRPDTPYSAARDGYFNPFAGILGVNSPGVLGFIGSGASWSRTVSEVATANLQVEGPLATWAGGEVRLAVGGQARRERLRRDSSIWVNTPTPVATPGADVARDVTAAFAELRVPLVGDENPRPGIRRLELSLAGRIEHYEVAGTTANPKLGVLWAPAEGVRLRATYGTSFRAPALRELTDAPLYSPTLLPLGAARVRTLVLAGGNPDLEPETARTWTAGVDLTPARLPGLSLSVTWFDVRFEDRIGQPAQQNLVRALSDPTLAPFVRRISPGTNADDRALIGGLLASPYVSTLNGVFPPEAFGAIVDTRFVNTAALQVSGVDVNARYRTAAFGGELSLAASGTYLYRYDQQITPASPVINQVDVANFPVRLRGRVSADWTRGRWAGGLAVNHTGAYHDAAGIGIDADTTVDLQLRLLPADHGALEGLTVALNVRNLFDAAPPFYDNPAGVGYDGANGDPVGRYVSLQLTRRW